MSHYIPREAYERLVAALQSSPSGMLDARSHIVVALGEIADIWPDDIKEECEAPIIPRANLKLSTAREL
ncbi:hypothetical protein [Phyllobacterium zundukense]|uniref:Uncharacterized protein n=1 Tax=Phyllobacterium zundukense TaxID=1867719 RepID=A0A2N9W459_9HYPH|nr:hypothetical protein [Phyllobacterium zundukense]ATU92003.1 hypothetical protein BLM14_10450 [Phyllobacterium zundukense]PIO46527.1 hypothetical protein B5P45_01630 [Phyllobacterium zundukense]